MTERISILILTYNAPEYVRETIETLNLVTNEEDRKCCEVIVVDNASENETKEILQELKDKNFIDKLYFSPTNTLFAKGNNIAASLSSKDSDYYLLLNSDILIKKSDWLRKLVLAKKKKNYIAASFGYCDSDPKRLDGYCFLIDKNIYDLYKLDEDFEWWWSVTKIQSQILEKHGNLLAIKNHDSYIYHYGGKSGNAFLNAKGMDVDKESILKWFSKSHNKVKVINSFFLKLNLYV